MFIVADLVSLSVSSLRILNMYMSYFLLNYISLAFFLWDIGKRCRPRSDATEGIRCLLTNRPVKI